jgi:hypothetical protein
MDITIIGAFRNYANVPKNTCMTLNLPPSCMMRNKFGGESLKAVTTAKLGYSILGYAGTRSPPYDSQISQQNLLTLTNLNHTAL